MKAIQFNILNSTNPINEVMGKLQKNEYSHVFFIKKEKEVITAICQNPSFAQQISSQISQQTVMIKSGEVLSQFYQEGKGILVCPTEPIVESSTENIRRIAWKIWSKLEKEKVIFIDLFEFQDIQKTNPNSEEMWIRSLIQGLTFGSYRFNRYKKEKDSFCLEKIYLLLPPSLATKAKKWVAEEVIELEGCFQARDLCNEPANLLNSTSYLKKIRSWGKSYGYKVSVLNKPKLSKLKMNGILAVNQGSNNPPYLVIGEYKPQKAKSHILLVGKGVTFDSGGISLKPSAGMGEMKMDMGGSAAVIGAINNVARLKLPVRVTSLIPLVENMPSASAQRPGDVITMYNGLTVEVDNTDAEGRLILADALSYGIKTYKPDLTIDLATLTGACVIALGHFTAGLYTNLSEVNLKNGKVDAKTKDFIKALENAGKETGERVWTMPLYQDYLTQLKSKVADLNNVGGRYAGSITAAKFLEQFTDSEPWCHIDIAGTAMMDAPFEYIPAGASGYGVRLLSRFIRDFDK